MPLNPEELSFQGLGRVFVINLTTNIKYILSFVPVPSLVAIRHAYLSRNRRCYMPSFVDHFNHRPNPEYISGTTQTYLNMDKIELSVCSSRGDGPASVYVPIKLVSERQPRQ